MSDIKDIEGIGPKNQEKLNNYGIFTIEDLRKSGETEEDRKKISEETGIYLKWIENWVEQAGFHKIDGVQEEYGDLLERAGFKNKKDIAKQKPLDLLEKLYKTNQEHNLVRRMPSINQIIRWIEQAKKESR